MFNLEIGEFTLKENDSYKKMDELMMKYDTKVDQNLQGLMDEICEMQNKVNDIEMNLLLNREILKKYEKSAIEINSSDEFNDMQRNTSASREPNKEVIRKKNWDSATERVSSDDGGSNNNQMKNIGRLCFKFVILILVGMKLFHYLFLILRS